VVSKDTAWLAMMMPVTLVAIMGACHRLVPAMPIDMALGILVTIAIVIWLAWSSDEGRK
jgi:hypothetical protein